MLVSPPSAHTPAPHSQPTPKGLGLQTPESAIGQTLCPRHQPNEPPGISPRCRGADSADPTGSPASSGPETLPPPFLTPHARPGYSTRRGKDPAVPPASRTPTQPPTAPTAPHSNLAHHSPSSSCSPLLPRCTVAPCPGSPAPQRPPAHPCKARHQPAPVGPLGKLAFFLARDFLAPFPQTRALPASADPRVQFSTQFTPPGCHPPRAHNAGRCHSNSQRLPACRCSRCRASATCACRWQKPFANLAMHGEGMLRRTAQTPAARVWRGKFRQSRQRLGKSQR